MNRLFIILSIILTSCVNKKNDSSVTQGFLPTLHDNHVHIMSPQLISLWKNMGIKKHRRKGQKRKQLSGCSKVKIPKNDQGILRN